MSDFEIATTLLVLGWVGSWFVEAILIRIWQLRERTVIDCTEKRS